MLKWLEWVNGFVWGIPALFLILSVGLYLSFRTGFAQLRLFPHAVRLFVHKLKTPASGKGVSSYQSLCTALAATVGTGNIAGVAGALALGGPGALFWMLMAAVVGMVLKLAEASLAVKYRGVDRSGNLFGGPMYMIEKGMGRKFRFLAIAYAALGLIAAFGVGNATQINAVLDGIRVGFGLKNSVSRDLLIGAVIAVVAAVAMLGGAKRIASFAEYLVPAASLIYVLLGLGVIAIHLERLPAVLRCVVCGAFSPEGMTGGAVGSFFVALRIGVSRGVFTNEAGMGTAAMAHGCAQVDHPIEQGLMGIVEVFLDTVVICTVTALAILTSGVPICFGLDEGAALTANAFSQTYGGWSGAILAVFLCAFAFATILGWGLYGCRCAAYLFGESAFRPFVILQTILMVASCALKTRVVWLFAETLNGLMVIPNLIALTCLTPTFAELLKEYKYIRSSLSAHGGTYESIDQCKPLRALSHEKIPSSGCGSRAAG